MAQRLPSRPNLDHLRRQAKSLLASLDAGGAEAERAAALFREHLPAAKGMSVARVRGAGFRLADAQSAVARKSGFAAWPALARHVEQLRALEGTWEFLSLEVDGSAVPVAGLAASRILIDGDRFRTESPEGTYEGVFTIDVEAEPHQIDLEFIAGPEAGRWNYGIFRVKGDVFELCLDMGGEKRPTAFKTAPGSGCAYEVLKRASGARPEGVTGGERGEGAKAQCIGEAGGGDGAGFEYVPSETFRRLEGEWKAVKLIRDGQAFPPMMLSVGRREGVRNEVKVWFGGQLIVHARMRIDEGTTPVRVDYFNLGGVAKGTVQEGIMEWRGQEAWFCMGAPGQPRPAAFEGGPGRTLSAWAPAKPARAGS